MIDPVGNITTIADVLIQAHSNGIQSLLSIDTEYDPNDPKKRILSLSPPSITTELKDLVYGREPRAEKIREAYLKFIKTSLGLYSRDAVNKSDDIFALEKQLIEIRTRGQDERNLTKLIQRFTLDQLDEEFKGIDLVYVIKTISKGKNVNEIIVEDVKYLTQLLKLIRDKNIDTLTVKYKYLLDIIKSYGSILSLTFIENKSEFMHVLKGRERTGEVDCLVEILILAPNVIGRAYIDAIDLNDNEKDSIEAMIEELKYSMEKIIDEKDWLDEETKERAKEKLTRMKITVGYPSWIKDDQELTKSFEIKSEDTDTAFQLFSRLKSYLVGSKIEKLDKEVDFDREWPVSPALEIAGYVKSQNEIILTTAFLKRNFRIDFPTNYNYAVLGHVIGHEIVHAFDDLGSLYDAEGRLRNWWSDRSFKTFKVKVSNMIEQYSNITDELTKMNLKGFETQGENIADNGAIRLAFRSAFNSSNKEHHLATKDLSKEKIFFLSLATLHCTHNNKNNLEYLIENDSHSPAEYRINVPLSNFDEFAKAFQCRIGSRMNPLKKVVVW